MHIISKINIKFDLRTANPPPSYDVRYKNDYSPSPLLQHEGHWVGCLRLDEIRAAHRAPSTWRSSSFR